MKHWINNLIKIVTVVFCGIVLYIVGMSGSVAFAMTILIGYFELRHSQ